MQSAHDKIMSTERRDMLNEARSMVKLPFSKSVREPARVRHARAVVRRYEREECKLWDKKRKNHEAVYADVRYVLMGTAHREEAVKMLRKLRASYSAGR